MSHPTVPVPSLAFLRRWVGMMGCLLLLIVVSGADELYDFAATDLRGTPSLVTLRSGQRSVTRSRRRAVSRRRQSRARKESVRRERIRYVRTRKPLRLPAVGRIAATRPIRPARKKGSLRLARSTTKSRIVRSARPTSNSKNPVLTRAAPQTTGSKPARSTPKSGGQSTFPTRLPPPVVLAARPPEADVIEEQAEEDVAEEVRQNLSLAFVTPRNAPAVGVRLVARVVPAQGEEVTYSDLQTDRSGRIKLLNIALPAAIDLDFPSQISAPSTSSAGGGTGNDTGSDNSLPLEGEPLEGEPLEGEPLEWDFADADRATLLLEKPLGEGRSARASVLSRLAVLRPAKISGDAGRLVAAARRVRVFEGEATPIVLERQVVDLDIAAPPGSLLSSPALEDAQLEQAQAVEVASPPFEDSSMSMGEALTVPPSGRVALRLPREALEEGPIPIRVARALGGGEAEAVIESYPTDAYALNKIKSPPLRLVRLSQLDMAGRVGVMGTRANVARRLGDLKGADNKGNALGSVTPMADGSEWWIYPETGIAFKMRYAPSAKVGDRSAPMFVERVRLFSANAGSFGRVGVGSTVEQMRASLGAPQVENDTRTPSDALSPAGRIDLWLEGGLRVCHDGSRVLWLESARPNVLLTGGTTAFVGRTRARLFIESFKGHPEIALASISDVRKYLEQAHGVETVGAREDADMVLRARVSEWKQDKASPSISATGPTERTNSLVRLQYTLLDANGGRALVENKQVEGRATAGIASTSVAGTLAAEVDKRKRAMQKAALDGGAKSIRAALDILVADVNRLSDFSVRVTEIDYQAGTLQLNAGRAEGLRASRTDPQDFEISIAGAGLPEDEQEDDLKFYTARVISVSENSAVCRLLRVSLFSRNGKEGVEEQPAPEMVRRLPDPTTGVVAARPWIPIALSSGSPAAPTRATTPRN